MKTFPVCLTKLIISYLILEPMSRSLVSDWLIYVLALPNVSANGVHIYNMCQMSYISHVNVNKISWISVKEIGTK